MPHLPQQQPARQRHQPLSRPCPERRYRHLCQRRGDFCRAGRDTEKHCLPLIDSNIPRALAAISAEGADRRNRRPLLKNHPRGGFFMVCWNPVFIPLGESSVYLAWREPSVYPAWREPSVYAAWRAQCLSRLARVQRLSYLARPQVLSRLARAQRLSHLARAQVLSRLARVQRLSHLARPQVLSRLARAYSQCS